MMEPATSQPTTPLIMREPLERFQSLIRDTVGDNAVALTLFGAIAAGSFDVERHTARSVLVVHRIDLDILRQLAGHGATLGKARIAAPLIMTPAYIESSRDTFPLELIEISQRHITLFGEDCFAGLTFEDAHVRLQCERELKATLIGLRQGMLAAAGRDKLLGALVTDVAAGIVRTLRGLLWLKNRKDAKPAGEVVDEVEQLTDRKLPGLRIALDTSAAHGWTEFKGLYRDVEGLGEVVDGW